MKKTILLLIIFLSFIPLLYVGARYGWRLSGFSSCISPTAIVAEKITISDGYVHLLGDTPHSASAYVGYIHEQKDGKLYIGLKYNMLFGFPKRIGAFDINIKCDTKSLSHIYFKNDTEEILIWNKD